METRTKLVYKTAIATLILLLLPLRFEAAENERTPMQPNTDKNKNRLADAASPYLQAHADNPVDWYEWGDEAFAKAKAEDKPIFLSIGYNACHWCHVMEHESFENDEIAAILNEHYVSIKVDREERPDIDQIYMTAVQAMTGSGGWPMSVFLTPDKKPFFSGTYFPPESRYGRPGFKEILTQLAGGYKSERDKIFESAGAIADHIARSSTADIPGRPIDKRVLQAAADTFYSHFDRRFGGFGAAPKFPQAANLSFLFRASHMTGDDKYAAASLFTLRRMAEGGIYDQLGGGFHRYSVDHLWLVPHFEKMLYDNALLVIPYIEAYQVSGDQYYLDIARGVLRYMQNEMTDTEGGFYSTQDADSEGEEGKYYTWTKKEVEEILGPEAEWFCDYFGITDKGNFEHGGNILHVSGNAGDVRKRLNLSDEDFTDRLHELKQQLLDEREKRIHPATDDKILASWNGLAISAFAQFYQVTGDRSYLTSAEKAADFILDKMTDGERLYHSYRRGRLLRAELHEDYAYFIAGLIDLYQAGFDERYLNRARTLARRAMDIFSEGGKLYLSPADDADLIYRPRDLTDGATPSPASVMILDLFHLGAITGDSYFTEAGDMALAEVSGLAAQAPQGSAALLAAGYFRLKDPVEVVIVGGNDEMIRDFNRTIFSRYIPNKIVVGSINGQKSDLPLLEGRQERDETTYYFCQNKTCRLPVTDRVALVEELAWVTGQASN